MAKNSAGYISSFPHSITLGVLRDEVSISIYISHWIQLILPRNYY